MQREYEEIVKDLQIVLPLKEGDIVSMLLKMKGKGSSMYSCGAFFQLMGEKLERKTP